MATTSSGNTMCDQVLGVRPRSSYIQWTRRRGHQVQRTRRRATEEAPASGHPPRTRRPAPEGPANPSPSQQKLQRADVHPGPDDRQLPATGRPGSTGNPAGPQPNEINGRPKRPNDRRPDNWTSLEIRYHFNRAEMTEAQRLPDVRTPASHRTTGRGQTCDA